MKNHITYPKGRDFSLKMLLSQQNLIKNESKKISKVGLFLKVGRAVKAGILEEVGTKKGEGRGRPQKLYRVVTPSVSTPEPARELVAA